MFGLLFALVIGWFYLQTRQARQVFLDEAAARAHLLTDAVLLHARGAMLAQSATTTLLGRVLGNSARFVDYLDGIAPFDAAELAAFADEAGLAVIRIVRPDGSVQGPADRALPAAAQPDASGAGAASGPPDCGRLDQVLRLPEAHLVLLGVARTGGGCVLVGIDGRQTEALESAIGLPRALEALAGLPGLAAVRMEGEPDPTAAGTLPGAGKPSVRPNVSLRRLPDGAHLAQARAPVAGAILLLDLDAGPLDAMHERLWRQFIGFALVLGLAGGLGTWVLYRHQRAQERRLLHYERRLSREREEAGLGRAAAAIAHEVRNPLNAMAMGLQRLQLEAAELTPEHRRLVDLVQEAVRRTNGTVTGLLDYARALRPVPEPVRLAALIGDALALYRGRISAAGLVVTEDLAPAATAYADPWLLGQVLDNLLRNALEAAPAGSTLEVRAWAGSGTGAFSIANDGFTLPAAEAERCLEPWFTTKPTGTGLGLAISRRIIAAQGGSLHLAVPRAGQLCVTVELPCRPPSQPLRTPSDKRQAADSS